MTGRSSSTGPRLPLPITAAGLLGLVIRLAWVVQHAGNAAPRGDAAYFYGQGQAMVEGRWFINPFLADATGVDVAAAHHPPLYSLFLGGLSAVGLDTPLEQRLLSALVGAAAVVVIGLVARRIAGDRVGAITAFIAAVNPNLWINDGQLKSESLYMLLLGGVLWYAYRYRDEPTLGVAVRLGVVLGLTALTRAEALMAFALVAAPVIVIWPGGRRVWLEDWPTKLRHLVAVGVAGLAVMAPWFAFNLARFERPVLLSYGASGVLPVANCDATYSGPLLGFYNINCLRLGVPEQDAVDPDTDVLFAQVLEYFEDGVDESVLAVEARAQGTDYIRTHLGRAPVVALARVGRLYGVYRPAQNLQLDEVIEHRGHLSVRAGLIAYYELMVLGVYGAIVLRRRQVTIAPFIGIAVMVTVTAVVAIGLTRYRVPLDLVLCLLGAVAIEELWRRHRPRWGPSPPLSPR